MADKRDANEREIISALVAAGAVCIQMSRTAGFDLIVCHEGREWGAIQLALGKIYIVEIKSEKGKLTQAEKATRDALEAVGCRYYIIRTIDQALEMIG